MLRLWLAATVVAMMTGVAVAQPASSIVSTGPQQPGARESDMTSTGSAGPTRFLGSMAPSTPGPGSQYLPTEGGDATTMLVPGQPPKLMSTPE